MVIGMLAAALAAGGAGGAWAANHKSWKGVSAAALIAAARATPVRALDYDQVHCDGALTLEAWLEGLAAHNATAIVWTAGPCQLSNDVNPLDAGGAWCAQAAFTLARPSGAGDHPTIEVYFGRPSRGRPGAVYAFRGAMLAADGPDYTRFRKDFEADWTRRFGPAPGACADPED